jgi:hypothetical protein
VGEQLRKFESEWAAWYTSLDPTVRGYFDEIFRRAPETVFEVFTGEALTDQDFEKGSSISEIVNPDEGNFPTDVVPFFDTEYIGVEPDAPEANTEFTVGWIEVNRGTASSGHADQVQIMDIDTGQTVFESERIEVEAMASNASAQKDVKVPGLPTGNYSMTLVLNVDGTYDLGEATQDKGVTSQVPLLFGVGGADPMRPSSPEQANTEAVQNAYVHVASVNNYGQEAEAQENVALALESYAGVIPAGLTAEDDLMPRILQAAQTVRRLEITDSATFQQAISADAAATAEVMQQVSGLSVTPAAGAEALLDFADKVIAAAG